MGFVTSFFAGKEEVTSWFLEGFDTIPHGILLSKENIV